MGIIPKKYLLIHNTAQTSYINLNMHRFTFFTVLAAIAMLTEAAPGGYYKRKPVPCKNNLVDVAVADGRFKTLVEIVGALGLADDLKNIKAATVFAPTDDAFNKIAAVLPTLTTADKLAIVKRHVIPNKKIKAANVPTVPKKFATLGAKIDVVKDAAGVGVSFSGGSGARSNVIVADVGACNGIIHAIDAVIL